MLPEAGQIHALPILSASHRCIEEAQKQDPDSKPAKKLLAALGGR
jgi:hypothetical protein